MTAYSLPLSEITSKAGRVKEAGNAAPPLALVSSIVFAVPTERQTTGENALSLARRLSGVLIILLTDIT